MNTLQRLEVMKSSGKFNAVAPPGIFMRELRQTIQQKSNAAVERPPAFLIFRRHADGRSAPTASLDVRVVTELAWFAIWKPQKRKSNQA